MKILISGAGIAGPALSFWLKHFGFSPIMIEKSPAIRTGGQALDIRGVAIALTKKMGVYKKIYQERTQIETGCYVDTNGKVFHEEQGEKFGFRQGEDVEILRGDLVRILMEKIEDIPCHYNKSISSIKENEDELVVEFSDGTSDYFDIVIGADGIHSGTRRMVFDESEYTLTHLGSYISTFTIPNYLELKHRELMCEANEKLLTISNDKDASSAEVGMMFRSNHILKDCRDESEQKLFLQKVYQGFGWEAETVLDYMRKSKDFYFDAIMQVKMEKWHKGRVVLIGDAGYCASPLSGQGNNLALVGAYILAGELRAANGDYESAFGRYNELLRPFVDANQQFGAWVSEYYLVNDDSVKGVTEERNSKLLDMIKSVSNGITLPDY